MDSQMTLLDWGVIVLFLIGMGMIGVLSTRLIRNTKDYFTGSGKMPWWLLGVSHHVSGYSAVAFTAYAAIAYNTGFTVYIWWAVPISFACFFGIAAIVARWSKLRTVFHFESPLEFLRVRYDLSTQQLLAWWGVLLKVLDVGAKWVAVSLVITTFAPGVPFWAAVLLALSLGLFYSTLGGLWAGTLTDFAMFIVQFAAGIAMFAIALGELGGVSALWTIWDRLPPGHLSPLAGEYGTWTCILGLTIINILAYNGGTWNLAQRYIAASDGPDAKKAAILSASLYLVWPLILFFPMWACPLLIPNLPVEQQEQCFSMMVIRMLPTGLTGLMLAALISHTLTMTTADATAITSVLVRDVLPQIWKKTNHFTAKQSLLLARCITFFFMLATALVAFANASFGGILGLVLGWFSALIGPVSVPMILGLLPTFKRCGVLAAHYSILFGLFTFVVIKLFPNDLFLWFQKTAELCHVTLTPATQSDPIGIGMTILLPTLVSLFVYSAIGLLAWLCRVEQNPQVNEFFQKLDADASSLNTNPLQKEENHEISA
ncbi:MAG: sodium:solute symporter family protein [Planctomycetia bacterium]|nr:sodium:solute symporter family protein [Planctomycetia bacterium]